MSRDPDTSDPGMYPVSWAQSVAVFVMLCGGGVCFFIYLVWLVISFVGAVAN